MEEQKQNEFVVEKIKERPLNKKKLLRRSIITASLAVIFGLVAVITFLVLEPMISNWVYKEEEPELVTLPEAIVEKSPEEMLTENMLQESQANQIAERIESITIQTDEEIQEVINKLQPDKDSYVKIYESIEDYTKELSKCMVTITSTSSNVDWLDNIEVSKNTTYGIIVASKNGKIYILADYAPIKKAEEVTVTFSMYKQASGVVKNVDKRTNLAIITVMASDLGNSYIERYVSIASLGTVNIDTIVGTPVVAMGSPMGTTNSMDIGMITSTFAQANKIDTNYKILQTNIPGSKNATGFMFNFEGQVIGVLTNTQSTSDMNGLITAVGTTELKPLVEKMMNDMKIPYLGITGVDVTSEAYDEYGVPYGAYITELQMDSPAMRAGIRQGDIIVKIGNQNINSYNDYANTLIKHSVGQEISVVVMRESQKTYKEVEFSVTIQEVK